MSELNPNSNLPEIDLLRPSSFETATFGMG